MTFRYSNIYDMNLAKWLGQTWNDPHMQEGKRFAEWYQKEWQSIENKVFKVFHSFGLEVDFEIIGYIVTPWKGMTYFSDPLTLLIDKNKDNMFTKTIHELPHIFLSHSENKPLKINTPRNHTPRDSTLLLTVFRKRS